MLLSGVRGRSASVRPTPILVAVLIVVVSSAAVAEAGFASAVNYGAGTYPYFVAVGDFNGDGKQDLAIANNASDNLSILLGNGNGTFQTAVVYEARTNPYAIVARDFNRDGRQDLAV